MLSIHWANNIKIENVKFHNNNIWDDVLNVVNSEIEIDNSLFEKCHMDCIDFDNSTGLIKNTKLYLAGNDLLDFMESNVKIQKTNLISAKDKCVSSGEKSFIKILETYFIDCNIGIASKDESIVNLSKSKFLNNKDNFSTYRKNFTYSSEGLIDEEI